MLIISPLMCWYRTGQTSGQLLWTTFAEMRGLPARPQKEGTESKADERLVGCLRHRWTHNQRATEWVSAHALNCLVEWATMQIWKCSDYSELPSEISQSVLPWVLFLLIFVNLHTSLTKSHFFCLSVLSFKFCFSLVHILASSLILFISLLHNLTCSLALPPPPPPPYQV